MSDDNVKPVIEALLLASEKPLTIDQIKNVLDNLPAPQIRQVLEELKSSYEEPGRGIRIIEVAGGFQLTTPPNLAPFVRKLFKERRVDRLSKPALETLAIIAYKQPVTKLEVESFRNVNIDGVMDNLLGKNLVRICGRKDAPGRPFVFGTTRQFLEYFGLKSLEELPKLEEFANLPVHKEMASAGKEEKIMEGADGPKEAA